MVCFSKKNRRKPMRKVGLERSGSWYAAIAQTQVQQFVKQAGTTVGEKDFPPHLPPVPREVKIQRAVRVR